MLTLVCSTARLTSADSRKSEPAAIITVEATRGPRAAAARSTSAIATEMVDSRPFEDMPRISSPSVEKKSAPPRKPSRAKTSLLAQVLGAHDRLLVEQVAGPGLLLEVTLDHVDGPVHVLAGDLAGLLVLDHHRQFLHLLPSAGWTAFVTFDPPWLTAG